MCRGYFAATFFRHIFSIRKHLKRGRQIKLQAEQFATAVPQSLKPTRRCREKMSNIQSLPLGTELVGDYRIERVLGAGGFGVTYLARETDLDRFVTIKEYFPTDFASRQGDLEAVPRTQGSTEDYQWGLDRFIDEARTLGKFNHPNIVRVYRYFRANNTAYMVLHFEEGQSLKNWLRNLGRAPRQKEIDTLIEPILEALETIHNSDFLHRDIAPDNIIVRTDGSPVLIDFGSARGEIAHHTRTLSALVKPGYSPYEQYAETGHKQGPWTDIYALAGTLYHIVTGKRPPDAPSRIIKDELVSAREAAIGAYRGGFLAAIDQGLVVDTDRRPQSIRQWRGSLLAPDEPQSSWFRRSPAAVPPDNLDPRTQPLAKTQPLGDLEQHLPQPDAPAPGGQFVDFVDRLKRRNQQRDDNQFSDQFSGQLSGAEAATSEPPASIVDEGLVSPPAKNTPPKKKSTRLFQLGWGARRKPAPPAAATVEIGASASAAAEQLPVVVPERAPPRVLRKSRPRPIRGISRPRWRPLVLKLLIGFGIAAGVVALQDRIPQFATRSSGTISSSSQTKLEKTTIAKQAPTQAQQKSKPKRPKLRPLIHRFQAHDGQVTNLAYADGGRLLVTAGADGLLKVWDAQTRKTERIIELDSGPATALAVYGHYALTGHPEGIATTWNLRTGFKLKSYQRNKADITAVAFAGSQSRFWVASRDWTIALWEARTPSAPLHVLKGHDRPVLALAYNEAGGLLMSGSADRRAKIWRTADYKLVRTYSKSKDFISAVTLSQSGNRLATGSLDGRIRTMSSRSRRYREIRAHSGAITGLAFSPNGEALLSASADGTIKVWRSNRRRPLVSYTAGGQGVTALTAAPDGSRFITGSASGEVRVWRGFSSVL